MAISTTIAAAAIANPHANRQPRAGARSNSASTRARTAAK
jgi:hypothetical protein